MQKARKHSTVHTNPETAVLPESEIQGREVGGAGDGKVRPENQIRISSWKVIFEIVSLCNREQREFFKSRKSLTLYDVRDCNRSYYGKDVGEAN